MNKLVLALIFIILSSCNKSDELSDLNEASDVIREKKTLTANFCTPNSKTKNQLRYYIFIVDSSFSNTTSDPNKLMRANAMLEFISSDLHTPQDRYQLITYNNQATLSDPSEASLQDKLNSDFTSSVFLNKGQLESSIQSFIDSPDEGNSDINSALSMAQDIITHQQGFEDYQKFEVGNNLPYSRIDYKIFVLTDGLATNGEGDLLDVASERDQIYGLVDTIVKLADKSDPLEVKETVLSVQINTGLYYTNSNLASEQCPTQLTEMSEYCLAKDLNKNIADKGQGLFREFYTGDMIQLEQFMPLTFTPIKNLAFYNVELAGLTWNKTTKKFEIDTDQDGLSDKEEITLGSSPTLQDSDGDGVTDYIQLLTSNSVCKNQDCSAVNEIYPGCYTIDNVYPDTDNDGLNDCEELMLGSSATSSDSNYNYISDAQMMRLGMNPKLTHPLWSDIDFDGKTLENELRNFTPHQIKNYEVIDKLPNPIYELKIDEDLSKQNDSKCYALTVKDLPITTQYNEVRLNLVFQDRIQNNPVLHQYAKKTFYYGEKMHFNSGDIKSILSQ